MRKFCNVWRLLSAALVDEVADGVLDELAHGAGFFAAELIHLGEFLDGEGDGEFGEHFIGHPGRDRIYPALPFVDGAGGAIAEVGGELFTGHSSLFAKETQLFGGHVHVRE